LLDILGSLGVADALEPVGAEEPGVARSEEREAELDAPADLPALAEILDGVALPGVIDGHGAREEALLDGWVAVAQREIVDIGAELPLQPASLPAAEEV